MLVLLFRTRCSRALRTLLLTLAWVFLGGQVIASETLVGELAQRLDREGIEQVNAALGTPSSTHLISLSQSTAACRLQAVSLSAQLARGSGSKGVVDAHRESLRVAVGSCTGFVLALHSPKEMPKVCASVASWTVSQMARELRRRIKHIETDELLRTSPRGQACRAAYLYELHNTRVGLRVGR